jgi:hypothetical protein
LDAVRFLNEDKEAGTFRILHLGHLPDHLLDSPDLDVTGWIPEGEFIQQLARMSIGFLNWPFEPQYAETGRTSFPLKIHSYIQAQVPMLALGPAGSAVARFVQDYGCGVVCASASAHELADCLKRFLLSEAEKIKAQKNVERLKQIFSRRAFFETFERFVTVSP